MRTIAAAIAAATVLAGCSGEQPVAGDTPAASAPTKAAISPTPAPAATVPPAAIDPASPQAAEGVVRLFLTRAVAGDQTAALDGWDGDPDAGAEVLAAIAAAGRNAGQGAPIRVDAAVDGDAGMGQRYLTVPFAIGSARGRAVVHRVADGIDADDPRVHDWRIRSVDLERH
ncbi:hypothetical protein [Sphingomonas sp. 1P08PE]|uniref:hypothetical protein n=1 Tax=Sphingomonas sp. 1P08PE TaxID=554122 RepID=UPI00399F007C